MAHGNLVVSFSLVSSASDNKPDVREFKWRAIVNVLSRSDEREDKDGGAFIPAKFVEMEYTSANTGDKYSGIYRRVQAVEHVSLAVADYDDGTSVSQARDIWQQYENVIYTSHSHTAKHNKFRVVIPLAEPILTGNWRSAWLHFFDLASGDDYKIDRSCKDPSRLYFRPSHPPGGTPLYFHNSGDLLALPITRHSSERPERAKWMKRHQANRTSSEGMPTLSEWLDDNGVHYELRGNFYKLHECPWSFSHTDASSKPGDAAVFVSPDDKWSFHCFHEHCSEKGWKDFREYVSPKKVHTPFRLGFGKRR